MKIKIITSNDVSLCDISHIEPLDNNDIIMFAKGVTDAEIVETDFEHNNINWKFGNFVILSIFDSLHMITKNDWRKIQSMADQIDRKNEKSVNCHDVCGLGSSEMSV